MTHAQPGILAPVPGHARFMEFVMAPDSDTGFAVAELGSLDVDERTVVGFGPALVAALGRSIDGLRPFPALVGPGCNVPSTQVDLWCWLRGDDRGALMHQGRAIENTLGSAFRLDRVVDGFKYGRGQDLSGYEDGTENPQGDDAVAAAIVRDRGPGLDGSSFVAVQQWIHDLDHLESLAPDERDNVIGRRLSDNEELDDAPPSAHVKRTAQESFEPEAFVVRRSMPWADAIGEGLMFVAFGKSLDAYEAQLRRMTGEEDGITDATFRFSRPISGGYFWCPPVAEGRLDLRALSL
jgi:putative iron-dependent peroxidase